MAQRMPHREFVRKHVSPPLYTVWDVLLCSATRTFFNLLQSTSASLIVSLKVLLIPPLLLSQLLVGDMLHVAEITIHSQAAPLLLEAVEGARDTTIGMVERATNRSLRSVTVERKRLDPLNLVRATTFAGLKAVTQL